MWHIVPKYHPRPKHSLRETSVNVAERQSIFERLFKVICALLCKHILVSEQIAGKEFLNFLDSAAVISVESEGKTLKS